MLRPCPIHLTIKLNRADIRNKTVLIILKQAIQRARLKGLKIIHFSLEHDHVHLYAESDNNLILSKAMQALGVSLAKRINRAYRIKGQRYKTRYHLRVLRSASEVKNVINYILKNGIKHRSCKSIINQFNSALILHDWRAVGIKLNRAEIRKVLGPFQKEAERLKNLLDEINLLKKELCFTFD